MSSYEAAPDRYDTMDYRFTGRSGLKLPAISLGLSMVWVVYLILGPEYAQLRAERDRGKAGLAERDGRALRAAVRKLTGARAATGPLTGPTGAAATYGPQKGADPEQVLDLIERADRVIVIHAGVLRSPPPGADRATIGRMLVGAE